MKEKIRIKNLSWGCFLFIFLLGLVSGTVVYVFLPRLAHFSPFDKISWLNTQKEGVTIINRTEKIEITQDEVLEKIISQVSQTVVGVKTLGARNVLLAQGSGFILTSDGLIATAASNIPAGQKKIIVLRNEDELEAEIIRLDLKKNLVLLKIEANNLPVVRLRDQEKKPRLGEGVFFLGIGLSEDGAGFFVKKSFISKIYEKRIEIDITEEKFLASGSPLFDIKGELLGMILVDNLGNLTTIEAETIKELLK